jgi:hypothetical protein
MTKSDRQPLAAVRKFQTQKTIYNFRKEKPLLQKLNKVFLVNRKHFRFKNDILVILSTKKLKNIFRQNKQSPNLTQLSSYNPFYVGPSLYACNAF